MAGSYQHCVNKDGSFNSEDFTGMIENLGDAHEACEHMYFMIQVLAKGDQDAISRASEEAYRLIREAGGQ